MITVPVSLGDRSYDVLVGEGARHRLLDVLPFGVQRAVVVTQREIGWEVDPGVEHHIAYLDDGEAAKNLETIEDLCRQFASWGLTRGDVVIGVGGGMVTDVAGFAAAVYHRGVPVVHVSTTLLGQIDAAIGGKTGVNMPEGKNLVGAFWQPTAVLCDVETLATLPPREYRSGLGEMAKYRFLGVPDLLDLPLDEKVAACVRIKADVVSGDEREGASLPAPEGKRPRAVLNYGHTLGHALEIATNYDMTHGECVGVGLVFAAELACRLGRIDRKRVDEHRSTVGAYDLPMTIPAGIDEAELVELMGRDKKAITGITFVLDGPDGVEPVTGVRVDDIRSALEAVR
ncbi:MAG: 3-dehydroquinate synthase [Acidobacteria bacterium]|nr:3-dehydroquinate synthase [Acidobacteriota bacterium]